MPATITSPESEAPEAAGADDTLFDLALEATETRQRSLLGGWFYVGGWLLVCLTAGFADALAWTVGVAMLALAIVRPAPTSGGCQLTPRLISSIRSFTCEVRTNQLSRA